ncbi:hypothetical protein FQJ10_24030 [Escherichia coli]|nr:hypothetical protein [Escherichia coli]
MRKRHASRRGKGGQVSGKRQGRNRRTHETDRSSLSNMVIQRAENDSDAFFWFSLELRLRAFQMVRAI